MNIFSHTAEDLDQVPAIQNSVGLVHMDEVMVAENESLVGTSYLIESLVTAHPN